MRPFLNTPPSTSALRIGRAAASLIARRFGVSFASFHVFHVGRPTVAYTPGWMNVSNSPAIMSHWVAIASRKSLLLKTRSSINGNGVVSSRTMNPASASTPIVMPTSVLVPVQPAAVLWLMP